MFGALNRLVLGQKQPIADARTFSISAFGWSAWSHNRLQGHSNTRHSHSRKSQRKPRRRPNYLEFIAPPPTIAGEESRVNVTGPINSAGIDAGHRVLVCQPASRRSSMPIDLILSPWGVHACFDDLGFMSARCRSGVVERLEAQLLVSLRWAWACDVLKDLF